MIAWCFPTICSKFFDRLERDGVLGVAEIDERPGVGALVRKHHLDRGVGINLRGERLMLFAA